MEALKKIAILDRSSSGWSAGESYTKSVLRSLGPICKRSQVELLLFTPGNGQPFRDQADLRIIHFPLTASKEGLTNALKEQKPSVVFPVLDDPVHKIPFPVIGWIPDLQHRFLPHFFSPSEIAHRDQLFQNLARQSVFLTTSSEASRKLLIESGLAMEETSKALPFPSSLIEAGFFDDPRRTLQKYRLPAKFALVANQFWKHKNHETVVQALAILQKDFPDIALVLTGLPADFRDPDNSTLSSLLQQVAASSLHPRVTILGQVPRADLVDLMRLAAVMIQPSSFEGWNTSVEDAKALGRPVICSDIAVLREQAPGALGFFTVGQAEGLAHILKKEWPSLAPGPDFSKEEIFLASAREAAEQFGQKLFDLCRQGASLGKIPDPSRSPVESDPQAWEIQRKDGEIRLLALECEKRLDIINKQSRIIEKLNSSALSNDLPLSWASFSPLLPPKIQDSLPADATPAQDLEHRRKALVSLNRLIEERELYVSCLPLFDFPKLGRKVANIIRFHTRQFQRIRAAPPAKKAPLPIDSGNAPAPAKFADLAPQISAVQKVLRLNTARYHHLESLLLAPPLFCPEAFRLKLRTLFIHPKLLFAGFLYKKWAKHRKNRLGILQQAPPSPVIPEAFPKPSLDDTVLPSVSIVTPSYNQAAFIEQTLLSVLDQKYPKLEYHVQDGNSKDGTLQILQRHDKKVSSWESAPDKGQSDAIVKGFARSTGEIMAWLNSDDLLLPGTLRFVGEYFAKHPEVDVLYGHRIVIDENGSEIGRWFLPKHDRETLKWADYVPQETLFWRRSAWEKAGGLDPSFHFALDWDLLLRFQRASQKIRRLPYFLGCFRVHSSQKTSSVIHSAGMKEMEQLRQREHNRLVSQKLVDLHVKPLLVKSAICSTLWRWGIRI